jgi:hypothetical protein
MSLVAGVRLIHTGMVVQLAMVKQERNAAILKALGACRSSSRKSRPSWSKLEHPGSKTRL